MAKAKNHPDYDVSGNTYNLKRQNLKSKGWDTEIGDRRNANKFVPRVKIQRWDDAFIEVGMHPSLLGGGDTVTHDGDAIVWSKGIYTAKFYDWTSDPDDKEGNGSFEWEFILASAPPVNSFSVDIRSQNVKLYYQAPLTAEEIANGMERPERVEGSYAVYHTTKHSHRPGEPNYEMGKIGHLYRPLATDDNGDTIWGSWNDDAESTGELTLTVDATWLAAAAYPVTIDPTFGYTTAGGSSGATITTVCDGSTTASGDTYTASTGDTITKFSLHCQAQSGAPGLQEIAAYSVSGGDPNGRLAASVTITTTDQGADAWVDSATVSQALSNGVEYAVCINDSDSSLINVSWDAGTGGYNSRDAASSGTLPATWTDNGGNHDILWSKYATYTAGGATRRVMVVS